MAIKRPDIYEHNNPNLAIVDSDFVRGGGRVVANLTELYDLSNKIDQLKERVTKVYVISEEITYVLVNKLDITAGVFNSTAWEEESGMSTVYTDGITITGDGSEESPLVANIQEETDPIFNASQAKNITSTHITVLNNTSGINTGDQDLSGLVEKIDNHSLVLDTEINKLATIEEYAEPNDPNTVIDANYVHTDNNYTDMDKSLLSTALQSEVDPVYSLDKDRLSNTVGTNTGDQVADNETITGSGSLNDPFIANIKVIESETPPLNPIQGLRWFNLTNGVEYTYLQDYWVDLNGGTALQIAHENLTDKNSEAAYQHLDTTTTKETLDEADKVVLYDSVTGKVVLSNALNDIKTILESI